MTWLSVEPVSGAGTASTARALAKIATTLVSASAESASATAIARPVGELAVLKMHMISLPTGRSITLEGSMKVIEITTQEMDEMLLAQTSADLATILATAIEKGLDTNRPYRSMRDDAGSLIFEQEEPGDYGMEGPALSNEPLAAMQAGTLQDRRML